MQPADVLDLWERLQAAGRWAALDGGWGVDALLGQMTREHADVDVVVELERMPDILDALRPLGLTAAEDHRPTRLVLRAQDGRQVDLHPVTFDHDDTSWQAGAGPDGSDCPYPAEDFVTGQVLGQPVGCISAALQVAHHSGYEPGDVDRADMARLAERFGLTLPHPY